MSGRTIVERRGTIFVVQLFYLGMLLAAAALYIEGTYSLPSKLGTLPLPVPWFGALGAVVISLTGAVEHGRSWDPAFAYWHISRPLVGATVAVVSVLVFQAGIIAVGSTPTSHGVGAPRNILYYVIAFAVGYRERTFRDLLKRVVDVLLTPGPVAGAAGLALLSLSPTSGPVAGGTAVGITGSALTGTQQVKFGPNPAQFTVDSDNHVTAVTPAATSAGAVAVTVTTKHGSVSGPQFTYM